MRILRLDLSAYGPFSGQTLTFAGDGEPGLHVIYGSNEAGKSSTLRALKAWLFGFPERTSDNFLHANEQLLVAGVIRREDGQELAFSRRKKRKADLLDAHGDPLAPETLAAWLPVSDQTIFESLYGLSHEDLVRGGEAILAQKGEVGQALFSAGAGTASLRRLMTSLETEAESLFKARGSKQEINLVLARHRELQKSIREASLSAREWHELRSGLDSGVERLAELEQRRGENERQGRQLERLRQLLPQLALHRTLRHRLDEFGEVVVLPEDFSAQRFLVEKELHAQRQKQGDLAEKLAKMREKRQSLSPRRPVLEMAEAIERLHQELGEYRKGQSDRPRLDGMRIGARNEAAGFLRLIRPELTLEQAEGLRPVLGRKKLITAMVGEQQKLRLRLEQAELHLDGAGRDLARTEESLHSQPPAVSADALREAGRLVRKAGDIDGILQEKSRILEKEQATCRQWLARIGLWQGEVEQTPGLQLPLEQTVRRYQDLFVASNKEERDIGATLAETGKKLVSVRTEIRALAYAGEVPTEEELLRVRARREIGWELVRRQWLADEEVEEEEILAYHAGLPLADAYAREVEQADRVADRLRREADRVHKFASLRAEEQALTMALAEGGAAGEEHARQRTPLMQEWLNLWQPLAISPLPPGEMLVWLAEFEKIRSKAGDIQALNREIQALQGERRRLRGLLLAELEKAGQETATTAGEALEPLLQHGEAVIVRLEAAARSREKLETRREELRDKRNSVSLEREGARKELQRWRQQWNDTVAGMDILLAIMPEEADDLLENLQNCFARLKEADDLRARMDGILRDGKKFEESLAALASKVAPETAGHEPAQVVARLMTLLRQARDEEALLTTCTAAIAELEEEHGRATAEVTALEKRLARLCAVAGRSEAAELAEAERRSSEYCALGKKLAETEKLLIEGAGGLTLPEVEARAVAVNPDELPEIIARLARETEDELAPAIQRLQEEVITRRNQLRLLDGNARAAEAMEESARTIARLRRLAERYLIVRLAARILRREMERFRAENQGPILKIAGERFRALTLGSFAGLRTDENEQEEPVLAGLRPDNSRVLVERMSSGSRDQLYLALRLASLEWRLGRHEPMPFIVDDILINFDDERSRATLRVLADIATRTQVILFTHHGRISEEARELAGAGRTQVHLLRS